MELKPDMSNKVRQALDSLEGIERAQPAPYFYTRLMARMEKENNTVWESTTSFLARPLVAVVSLCFILIVNAFILLRQDSPEKPTKAVVAGEQQIVTDNEYVLASNSSFDYENIEQQ